MKHTEAFSHQNHKLRDHVLCETPIEVKEKTWGMDVPWTVYYCPTCDQYPVCVDGGAHRWNYHLSADGIRELFGEDRQGAAGEREGETNQ